MGIGKDFIWGTATSSYQIEGGALDEGRGECIWYRFSHTPGTVRDASNGDVACDHLHRYADDIGLMTALGIDAYRFSIAWSRVLPAGTGAVNELGVGFYDSLVDKLLEAGIKPYVTLYHWDLPQALQDRGGWESPDSVSWYAEYAELISRVLGDRVKNWITFNEPWVFAFVGNLMGAHAPGKTDPRAAFKVAHHTLLSHGAAVPIIRANSAGSEVGITLDEAFVTPASLSEADRRAARTFTAFHNDWFLEPLFLGNYPTDFVRVLKPTGALDGIDLDAVQAAAVPIDFVGVNYYRREIAKAGSDDPLLGVQFVENPGAEYTEMNWEVFPDGLTNTLLYLSTRYKVPKLYITENGCAYPDQPPVDGLVSDPKRVSYYQLHLDAVSKAIDLGAPVAGYFAWSLMDNFEWGEGYTKRFGLYYVDYETQIRTPKQSALYYRDRIAATRA